MKWTYDWLKDYLNTDASPTAIADKLTEIGLEIESVEIPVAPIAAKIVECDDIPETHLHNLLVDDGTGTLRHVVCGAPNARAGLVSALALPGCKIGGHEIKSGKIRGFLSDGMMCSAKELEISDDHSGIIELDESIEVVGKPVSLLTTHHSPLTTDAVFDAGITPNRPDYLAVRGIARDLAAAGLGVFLPPRGEAARGAGVAGTATGGGRKAEIKNAAACPVYRLCEIHGIGIAPSNPTVAGRLTAIGITPRNAPVDATNYVCYDFGQPMHCFDADEIHGDIIIRNATNGEKFTDLFGAEHVLADSDLVITDTDGILALAGVVGGARGMTTDRTKNIILESAYFSPIGIRKTAKRLGLQTDASYRYERGIDPMITGDAIAAAAKLIMDVCGGAIVGAHTAGQNPAETRKIAYSPALFKQKTGIDLAPEKQKEILEKLGFKVDVSQLSTLNSQLWHIVPTPARIDVEIPENIVSELIRIYGYGNIPARATHATKSSGIEIDGLKAALAARGLYEQVSYGFGDSAKEQILSDAPQIKIANPIVANFDTARNGLVQNMLDAIAANDRFKRSNLNLFELGAVFDGDQPGQQHDQLVIARTGIAGAHIGAKHGRDVEIYDVREDLMALFGNGGVGLSQTDHGKGDFGTKSPHLTIENDPTPPKWANPYRAGRIVVGANDNSPKTVAQFAELHPMIAKKFGIKTNVVLGLVNDVSVLPEQPKVNHKSEIINHKSVNEFPEFPFVTRDFAFVVDNAVSSDAIVKHIADNNALVYETNVFDVFDLGNGKKSVAFELILQPTSNMSDGDLLDFQNKVISEIESTFNAKIRDR
ncbi:MAG: phenylalanine--tRNA ligase subunit beta [Proteobacteria bacterium]|nr:phenylalanine--tRNA ligase subunit beta [Pseudomonadota bacterium]